MRRSCGICSRPWGSMSWGRTPSPARRSAPWERGWTRWGGQLETAEREALTATAEDEGLERREALFARRPAAFTAADRRAAIAALLQIDGDSLTPSAIDATPAGLRHQGPGAGDGGRTAAGHLPGGGGGAGGLRPDPEDHPGHPAPATWGWSSTSGISPGRSASGPCTPGRRWRRRSTPGRASSWRCRRRTESGEAPASRTARPARQGLAGPLEAGSPTRRGETRKRVSPSLQWNEKARRKRYVACDELVPVVGLEPTRCRHQRILSPSRLPIPSHRQVDTGILYRMRPGNSSPFSPRPPGPLFICMRGRRGGGPPRRGPGPSASCPYPAVMLRLCYKSGEPLAKPDRA